MNIKKGDEVVVQVDGERTAVEGVLVAASLKRLLFDPHGNGGVQRRFDWKQGRWREGDKAVMVTKRR